MQINQSNNFITHLGTATVMKTDGMLGGNFEPRQTLARREFFLWA
jgi:hypothetical protein